MVRLGNIFASAALLVLAVAAPASSQTGATPGTVAVPSSGSKTQAASGVHANASSTGARAHRKKKQEPVAQVPQTPPPPPTLDQQPPTPPQVSYRDGLLSINAPNSTLSSVLRAVQSQTGATMEVPASAQNDRVVMAIGPGQPRDVLNTLLNGSTFDYMILGISGRPGAVQRVILTPKTAGGATTQAANNAPPAEESSEDAADTGGESEYPGPPEQQQPMPPGAFRRPMGAPGGQAYQQQQQEQQQNPFPQGESDNVVKTPEQLMQELQQMQQQQQQYQEQLNPANQNPQQQ